MTLSLGGNQSSRTTLSFSPDGSRLAYSAHSDGKIQLYIRELNQLESRPLGAAFESVVPTSLAFSPDGEALAYYEGNDLKRVSVNGGGTQTIAADVGSRLIARVAGLDWAEDNSIVMTDQDDLRLMRITVNSGSGQIIDIPLLDNAGQSFYGESKVLPGGMLCSSPGDKTGRVGARYSISGYRYHGF
jgi:WD40 repeat protein